MGQRDWIGCRKLSREIIQVRDPRDSGGHAMSPADHETLLGAVQTGSLQRIASLLDIVFGNSHDPVEFVDRGELGQAIGLPWKWLDEEAKAGRIPCLTIGKTRHYRIGEVRKALSNRACVEERKP